MKIKNILALLSISLGVAAFTGCSNDNDSEEFTFVENVILNDDFVELDPHHTVSVEIKSGNGGYTVASLDETIATAELIDNAISITGHAAGKTAVVITDKEGVESLVNILIYSELEIATNEIASLQTNGADGDLGLVSIIKINSGNGGYKVETLEPNLNIRVSSDSIIVNAIGEFTNATAKLTDRSGRSVEFTVATAVDLYKSFKADATLRTVFKEAIKLPGAAGYTYFEENKTTFFRYGWSKAYSDCLDVKVNGDLKVGIKAGSSFKYGMIGTADYAYSYVVLKSLAVVKNKGGKVWIAFVFNKSNVDYTGLMVQNEVK